MPESLNQLLANLHAERERTWAAADLQVNINQRRRLLEQAPTKRFVRSGDSIAAFELHKVEGGRLTRDGLLADGPAVLVFFRFAGCPACNLAIPYYDRQLYPQLQEWGVPLIAVSPQVPERLIDIKTRHNLRLQLASDLDNQLAQRLGILYHFDEASQQAALAKGPGIGVITGTRTWELPQPTVVVIGQDQRVHFAQVSPDWLVRTEAEPILEAVRALLPNQIHSSARSAVGY